MKTLTAWLLIACLTPYLTGCENLADISLTGRLWSGDLAYSHNQPTPYPNLQVSQAPKDYLVQYDEEQDRTAKIRRRAYWLFANEARLEKGEKPRFVSPHKANGLPLVPTETNTVAGGSAAGPPPTMVVLLPDQRHFTLVSNGSVAGTYYLPAYGGGLSKTTLVVLTPLAVIGDVAICAAVVGAAVVIVYVILKGDGQEG